MFTSRTSTRFILTCAPRTGSTMLRMMLDSHPDIVCRGELFTAGKSPNLKKLANQFGETQADLDTLMKQSPVGFLHQIVWNNPAFAAQGCKIKYQQLEELFPELLESILDDGNVKVIHLRRSNLVKRYVSNLIAGRKMTANVIMSRDSGDNLSQPRIALDYHKCVQDVQTTKAAEKRILEYFKDHSVCDLTYEQLLNDRVRSIGRVQNFLGVEPIDLTPKTVKINSDRLEDIVENYEEFKRHAEGGPIQAFL